MWDRSLWVDLKRGLMSLLSVNLQHSSSAGTGIAGSYSLSLTGFLVSVGEQRGKEAGGGGRGANWLSQALSGWRAELPEQR